MLLAFGCLSEISSRVRRLICGVGLIFVFALCHFGQAAEVELSEVRQHFGKGGTFEFIRIYNVRGASGYRGQFIAQKFGDWSLELVTEKSSPLPLDIPEKEILGDEGILFECLAQFLADVPHAIVDRLTIEFRMSSTLWAGYEKRGEDFFGRQKGNLTNVKATKSGFDDEIDSFLAESSEMQEIAEKVARELGRNVAAIKCQRENCYFAQPFFGKPVSDLASLPVFGLEKPDRLVVFFKRAAEEKERKPADR